MSLGGRRNCSTLVNWFFGFALEVNSGFDVVIVNDEDTSKKRIWLAASSFLSVCRSFGDDMHVQLVEIEEYEDTLRGHNNYVDVNACVFNPQSADSRKIHCYHFTSDETRHSGNFDGTSSNVLVAYWKLLSKGRCFSFQWVYNL